MVSSASNMREVPRIAIDASSEESHAFMPAAGLDRVNFAIILSPLRACGAAYAVNGAAARVVCSVMCKWVMDV